MGLPFALPPPVGYSESPTWNGIDFLLDGKVLSVLEYSENFQGWSDDLTAMHEEAAGNNHPIDVASRNNALTQAKNFLPPANAVIMEIGCSSGFLLRDIVSTFPAATILGVDVVKEPLYKLAKILPKVPLIRFDLLQCPLPGQIVDVLIMLNVLEHIEDDLRALQNAFKLLKPGGHLIIEVPAGPLLYDSYDAELHHFRRYSSSELYKKLKEAGFSIEKSSHLGFILFPAFAAVKLLNKYLPSRANKPVVHRQVSKTSSSWLVNLMMRFETKFFKWLRLPFGIRAIVVAKKMP